MKQVVQEGNNFDNQSINQNILHSVTSISNSKSMIFFSFESNNSKSFTPFIIIEGVSKFRKKYVHN